jgi:FMN phosphatase YigB (HAD superfamily)
MQKYIFILVLMMSGFLHAAISEIREINRFSGINFDAMVPGDLVLFDVDDVLIEPADKVGMHSGRKKVIQAFNEYVSVDDSEECVSIMLRDMRKVVIEYDVIEKIKRLQERGVIVIALTSSRIGKFGVIDSWEEVRYELLRDLGFSWSFEDDICSFHQLKKKQKKHAPLFFKGLIIVEGYSKGDALGSFLMWKQLQPSRIFFIDNCLRNIFSVQDECEERSIPFTGYHYLGGSQVELDEEKMHKQFWHLSKHKVWLSDEVCQNMSELEFKD